MGSVAQLKGGLFSNEGHVIPAPELLPEDTEFSVEQRRVSRHILSSVKLRLCAEYLLRLTADNTVLDSHNWLHIEGAERLNKTTMQIRFHDLVPHEGWIVVCPEDSFEDLFQRLEAHGMAMGRILSSSCSTHKHHE